MADRTSSIHEFDEYERFAVAVHVAVFTIRQDALCVALVPHHPAVRAPALPGGFVRKGEELDEAAARSLEDQIGPGDDRDGYLEQIGSYAAPEGDPQLRVVTVAYFGVASEVPQLSGDFARGPWADLLPVDSIDQLPLDPTHRRVIDDGLERVRSLLEYTTFASRFLNPVFTVSELRRVYELVWNVELDSGNFRRNIDKCGGFERLDASERSYVRPARRPGRGRPASLWSARGRSQRGSPGALLARALASRDRGGSLLGIRTRSTAAPRTADTSKVNMATTPSMSRNRFTYQWLSGGSYEVLLRESGESIGRVDKRDDGLWRISSLKGRHPSFETRSDAAFYLWAVQIQPTVQRRLL